MGRVCPVLVGRADLLALADRRLDAALAGSGHLLFLAGEAGIGKTRMLAEILDRARDAGAAVVTGAAFAGDIEAAGGVLIDLAAQLRQSAPGGWSDAGAGMGERLADSTVREGDAHRRRRMLVADLAIAFVGLATQPTVVALEDLHWADDLTLAVLDRVARRLGSRPMLVVGTYRSDELDPRVPMRHWRTTLLNQRLAEEVRLPRLGPDGTVAMVAAITGQVVPETLTEAVHRRSDGIPLHVEELLATVSVQPAVDAVPDTLADAVLARAATLTGPTRELAGAASVIGRSFDLDLITTLTGVDPADVDRGLHELVDHSFVHPRADRSGFEFRHALIRDALYADLPPHRRRALHGRVAQAAAAAGAGSAFVSDHFERAGQARRAYQHAVTAAAEAAALSAHRESVQLYRRAQRCAPTVTADDERADLLVRLATELAATDDNAGAATAFAEAHTLRRRLGDDAGAAAIVPSRASVAHLLGVNLDGRTAMLRAELTRLESTEAGRSDATAPTRVRLLAAVAAAYMLDRRLDESIEYGESARQLASRIGESGSVADIDATHGAVLVFAGRMDEGWRLLHDATGRSVDAGTEAEAARGYRMLGTSASVLVEYGIAVPALREGMAYAERVERLNDYHYMAAHLAHVQWATGDWAAAEATARGLLANGLGGITTRITTLHVLGYLGLGRSQWDAATAALTEARELGEEMRELQRLSPALWGLAEVALHCGRTAEAVDWCERGFEASAQVTDAAYLFPFVVTGTRAYLRVDDLTGARTWLRRAGDRVRQRNIPGTIAALDHAEGLVHLAGGHTGKAREALARAERAWTQRHRFWEGTQALIDQARCATKARRPADAASLLARARVAAEAADAGTLLALARPAGARTPEVQRGPGRAGLTSREVEVARLIATGATNRQIAESLRIAPKTVAAHVEHILTKLGAARRAEVAAWVASELGPGNVARPRA